jgi:hypothetical protein
MAACKVPQPVEMRLDMAKQRVGQMDTQEIGERWIGAIEIQSRRVRREQSRLVRSGCDIVLEELVHLRLLLVPP